MDHEAQTTDSHRPELPDGNWRRSSRCANSGCVEVNATSAVVQVRDSKQPGGPILTFDSGEWQTFVTAVKNGEFDT